MGLYGILGCQQCRATRPVLFREVILRNLAANLLEMLEHPQLCTKGPSREDKTLQFLLIERSRAKARPFRGDERDVWYGACLHGQQAGPRRSLSPLLQNARFPGSWQYDLAMPNGIPEAGRSPQRPDEG